jgi:spore maturation protein CgeB
MGVINHDQAIIIKSTRETLNCVLFFNMTLNEFLALDEMEQAEAVWDLFTLAKDGTTNIIYCSTKEMIFILKYFITKN